jgi:hypothetical protein
MSPGSHIGVVENGQFTVPAQTSPYTSNAAHFRVKFVKENVSGKGIDPLAFQDFEGGGRASNESL